MEATIPMCQATAKQTKKPCGNFAVKGRRVCHIHGGKTPKHNPGAKTKEGKLRQKMANWKHGFRSKEILEELREEKQSIRDMIQESKRLIIGN